MASSIRSTLLGWYGLVVLVVVAGFGISLYRVASDSMLEAVDAGLADRAAALAGALEWDEEDGWELELSDDYLAGLGESARFGVWEPGGELVRARGVATGEGAGHEPGYAIRDGWRELVRRDSRGALVVVARPLADELARRRRLAWSIGVGGALSLAVALIGGWWIASRSLAPIARIAATAAGISERDLGGRVDPAGAARELRSLALTLNGAFDRLETALVRQRQFTADASHELRTPLSVLRAQVDVALSRERTAEEYQEALRACGRAARRLSLLADGLLELARLDDDGARPEPRVVNLAGLVDDTIALLRPEAERQGLTLTCDATAPALVAGREQALRAVLENLLANAIEHNRPGGEVRVRLEAGGGAARVTVRDTGAGIPREELDRIFERFYRVDRARSRARGGAGLGLAIVRSGVEAHGGSVAVESTEGEGSRFTVVLPLAGGVGSEREA